MSYREFRKATIQSLRLNIAELIRSTSMFKLIQRVIGEEIEYSDFCTFNFMTGMFLDFEYFCHMCIE